jgi:hypothetical protein
LSGEERLTSMEIASIEQANSDMALGQGYGISRAARQLWAHWKIIARRIGDFQARALMTAFYFLVLGPVALALRWRSDPLAIKPTTPRGWNDMESRQGTPMEQSRRQF